MPKKRVLPYGINDMEPIRPKKVPPRVVTFIAVLCTVLAGLGDWGVINNLLKGLPKAITLGAIACAIMNYLVEADFANIKKGKKIIGNINIGTDQEIKSFIDKVRLQTATAENLTPHILGWLKKNKLTTKIKLRF